MKYIVFCLTVFMIIVLFSCTKKANDIIPSDENIPIAVLDNNPNINEDSKSKNISASTSDNEHMIHDFPVLMEYDIQLKFVQRHDNLLSNINVIYKPESDSILNIHEIDNTKINDVFDKPILNKDIIFLSYVDIFKLLRPFEITPSEENIRNINNLPLYGFPMNKVTMENLNLYFYKTGSKDWFHLFLMEYENNSNFYDYNIKIGTSRDEIKEIFGEPAYYSEDRNIYLYYSFSTNRQMNIIFDNDMVTKIQLIIFDLI